LKISREISSRERYECEDTEERTIYR